MGAKVEVSQTRETAATTPLGPRARRLLSYIGVLARGWAAYVGYVAPQCVAMAAIWLPKGHH